MGTYRLLMGIYVTASLAYSIYNLFVQPVGFLPVFKWVIPKGRLKRQNSLAFR